MILTRAVQDLVMRHIDSVIQLEALLFLRERPAEPWDLQAIARQLYAPDAQLLAALSDLCRDGLVLRAGTSYIYASDQPAAPQIDALADAYARHLIPLTELIHSKHDKT